MSDGITRAAMARLAGLAEATVRYHLATGRIRPLPNGRLDPADADLLRSMANVHRDTDQRSADLLRARALGGMVKTRRLRMQVHDAQAKAVEREPLQAAVINASRQVTKRIATWPARYAAQLAVELGVEVSVAAEILKRFAMHALAELGDTEAEAVRACGGPDPRKPQVS